METDFQAVNGTLLVLPTSGQILPTQTARPNVTQDLGGPPLPTTTQTFNAIDWSTISPTNILGPPSLNIGTNVTLDHRSSTDINGTLSNLPSVIPRNEKIEKRDSLPAVVDWRKYGGLNWVCNIQVSM